MSGLPERFTTALGDRYRIEREIGRGGMGVVLLAHDLKHDRKAAIKVLRQDAAPACGDRFLREIQIAAHLQHPNILPLIDSGEVDGMTYYVMPFVEGESLRARLAREKQLPLNEALAIAREVADALEYAHAHGVVHRDIKPENILFESGHALVTDFGIARALSSVAGERLTETGVAVGTPEYMSPEQAGGTGELDHRSDIYSLGCVLYEMLAGMPPYTGTSPMAIIARKALEPVPGLRVVRDTVPQFVEDGIRMALAKVPADRFSSARQFADAISGDTRAVRVVSARGSSRRRWLLAGSAGTLAMLAAIYVLVAGLPFMKRAPAPAVAHFTQLTSMSGAEWSPSLSPDGRWIVYAGQQSGNRDIYLQSVSQQGGQETFNLTASSPADDDQPAFSPDGDRIAFRSSRDGGGIFVMGRTGEAVRRLTDRGFHPTWSSDGRQVAFTNENVELMPGNSEGVSELWVVDAAGGAPRRLYTGDAVQASWSPHGERIAFAHRLGRPAHGDIWTIPAKGGDPVPVMDDQPRDWSPTWSPDGKFIYFASDSGGSMNLWRIPVDEKSGKPVGPREAVTTPATFLAHPAVAGTGHAIAYTSAQLSVNIQRLTLDSASGNPIGEPVPVTSGSRQWSAPDPSPDGRWVAFYSFTQPEGRVYVARPDGSGLRLLTPDTAIDRVPRWSPDGKWIAFFSNRGGQLQVWAIRPDGSDLRRVWHPNAAYVAWSPRGPRMAVAHAGSTTIIDGSAVDANSGFETIAYQKDKFFVNSWSPDSQYLVGQLGPVGFGSHGIAMYSLKSKQFQKLVDFGEWPVWLPDSRRVLFVAGGKAFYIVDATTKRVRKVFEVQRDVVGPPRITRDGRNIYFSRRVTEADVWMLDLR
ncbi:MAG TPA: protein kinase [Gemmatimonadaceae bacterium]|nr:protein kinase [Gemmatimonadaceae bacterium]